MRIPFLATFTVTVHTPGRTPFSLPDDVAQSRLEDRMIENKVATRQQFDDIWAELRNDIEVAIKFAEDSPYPAPDQIMVGVYTSMSGAN